MYPSKAVPALQSDRHDTYKPCSSSFPLLPFFLGINIVFHLFMASVTDSHCALRWIPEMASPQLFL